MRLKNAARYFDTCPVYDGYSGVLLFKIQGSTFLESSAEGSTAARRTISMDPAFVVPAHSCLLILDQLYILGGANPDEWAGTAIRRAFWTRLVSDSFRLLTPAEAVLQGAGTHVYGQKKFLREAVNTQTDAELDAVWELSLSASLDISRGYFLQSGSTLYRVRMSYKDTDGFLTCQSDEVDYPVSLAKFDTSSTYDPVADRYLPGSALVKFLPLDYSKAFTKTTIAEYKVEQGDIIILVPKSQISPVVGQTLTILPSHRYEGAWRVKTVTPEHDAWNLHIRRT